MGNTRFVFEMQLVVRRSLDWKFQCRSNCRILEMQLVVRRSLDWKGVVDSKEHLSAIDATGS